MGCAWFNSAPLGGDSSLVKYDTIASHTAQVAALKHWGFTGKLAVKKGGEGLSVRVSWYQNDSDYSVSFRNFLLGEVFSIEKSNSLFVVDEGQGARYEVESGSEFLRERFGFVFPESSIPFWLKGIPAPIDHISEGGPGIDGRYRDFSQSGWWVTITEYDERSKPPLPRKIKIANGQLELSIVVNEWRFY